MITQLQLLPEPLACELDPVQSKSNAPRLSGVVFLPNWGASGPRAQPFAAMHGLPACLSCSLCPQNVIDRGYC
jgi:hypothetical protein